MKIDLSHAKRVLPLGVLREYDIEKPLERARLKTDLFLLVSGIISELPESQQKFFRDYYLSNLNQSQVAKMYRVSPQAITNRISKLKRAVRKKLEIDYGLTAEIVITILNFRDYNQYMWDELQRSKNKFDDDDDVLPSGFNIYSVDKTNAENKAAEEVEEEVKAAITKGVDARDI